MTEAPLKALYRAINNQATAQAELWGTQVSMVIQPSWARPYLMMYYISGGEANAMRQSDAEFLMGIKGIADDMDTSMAMAARVSTLFNDKGTQDVTTGALNGGTDWEITTSTQERVIHMIEMFSNSQPIYHDGHTVRFVMQLSQYECE